MWKRGDTSGAVNTVISGAAGNEYIPVQDDYSKYLTVTVGRSDRSGGVTSAAVRVTRIPGSRMTRTVGGKEFAFRYVPKGKSNWWYLSEITHNYWLGETEVTQEQYLAVMGINPSDFDGSVGKEPAAGEVQTRRPVENVNWYEAIAFCNKLSLMDGKNPVYSVEGISDWAALAYSSIPGAIDATWNAASQFPNNNGYRLPSQQEWHWAARGAPEAGRNGGTATSGWSKTFAGYTGGTESSVVLAVYDPYVWACGNSGNKTHEVGKKTPNELYLYDMSGNVGKWCRDWDTHPNNLGGTHTDWMGPGPGDTGVVGRVLRGGYFGSASSSDVLDFSLTSHNGSAPNAGGGSRGLRIYAPDL